MKNPNDKKITYRPLTDEHTPVTRGPGVNVDVAGTQVSGTVALATARLCVVIRRRQTARFPPIQKDE